MKKKVKQESYFVEDVLDIKRTDKILVISDHKINLGPHKDKIEYFKPSNIGDLEELYLAAVRYNKVIVSGKLNKRVVSTAVKLSDGLTLLFTVHDKSTKYFVDLFESDWYPARAWSFNTSQGQAVVTDARGVSLKERFLEQEAYDRVLENDEDLSV